MRQQSEQVGSMGENLTPDKYEDFTLYQHLGEFETLLQKQLAAVDRVADD